MIFSCHLSELGECLRQPWKNCTALGRAYDLVRADVRAHLGLLQKQIGFRYCRFHGLFHDDMGVAHRRPDGTLEFHWHHVDEIFDALRDLGLRPFVELNPMPLALASGEKTVFHYRMNITPPRKMAEWEELVISFAVHAVRRYGLEEVRKWYFEVWNEPNLDCFWAGDYEAYLNLYAASANALKSVDSSLRVGGPATAMMEWLPQFIESCRDRSLPLDFVSTHVYPMDEFAIYESAADSPFERGQFFPHHIRQVAEKVAASSMPGLEIHWTEWNAQTAVDRQTVTFMNNVHVDSCYAAAFIVDSCVGADALCHSLTYWAATDIFEEHPIPTTPFSCSYGLVTPWGLKKASANAFMLLSRMRGNRLLARSGGTSSDGTGAVVTTEGGLVHILVWNHRAAGLPDGSPWAAGLLLSGLAQGAWIGTESHIKPGAGSAWEAWVAMGRPINPTPAQTEFLSQSSIPRQQFAHYKVEEDSLNLSWSLGPGEVLYVELAAAGHAARPKDATSDLSLLEKQLGQLAP